MAECGWEDFYLHSNKVGAEVVMTDRALLAFFIPPSPADIATISAASTTVNWYRTASCLSTDISQMGCERRLKKIKSYCTALHSCEWDSC